MELSQEELALMIDNQKLVLKGKRWWKFHEFTIFGFVFTIVMISAVTIRFLKVGFVEWQSLLFAIVPLVFLVLWLPYKNSELKFFAISTKYNKSRNYKISVKAIKKLNWTIKADSVSFIEANTSSTIGLTWGSDMIFILIDDQKILVNSICDLERIKQQSFFTFGKLRRNVKSFVEAVKKELESMQS